MEVDGKLAMIVGGASGMARATAELLHAKGASIAILDLASSASAEVAARSAARSIPSMSSTRSEPKRRCGPRSRRSEDCT